MDRSLWVSLLLVVLSMALVVSGRAGMDVARAMYATELIDELDRLEGRASSAELADRVTGAAGCIRGFRPPIRSCWYAWAEPSRPDYLRVVAERVRTDAAREAVRFVALALLLWALVLVTAWKATRPKPPYRPPPIHRPLPAKSPPGRLMP